MHLGTIINELRTVNVEYRWLEKKMIFKIIFYHGQNEIGIATVDKTENKLYIIT